MPLVSYNCPECKAEIKTDDSLCGEAVKCPACGAESRIPIPGIHAGMNLGGFVVEKQLGVGGMGEVWLARQEKLDRRVALKILSPKYTSNSSFVERFMSEVRNTAKLEHPNIVTAFHAGVENGAYYLAISYVSGNTVFDRLKEGRHISEKEALDIARAVADALDYAWAEFKILHRDIKPSNIMIDKKGVPKLMDMGISKSLDEQSSLTMMGMMIGTPYYVSPEQAIGAKDIDFRADIYSLGATLYHMLTGNVPFDASTAMAIISKHMSEPLPDPRNYNSTLNDQTVALIKIMMAKDKNDRQKSWRALIEDIDRVLGGQYPLTPVPEANKTTVAPMSAENPPAPDGEASSTICAGDAASKNPQPGPQHLQKQEKQRSRFPLFLLLPIVMLTLFLLAVALAGAYLAYRYWKSEGAKRRGTLPTEIIVKPRQAQDQQPPGVDDSVRKLEQVPGPDAGPAEPVATDKPAPVEEEAAAVEPAKTPDARQLPENLLPEETKPEKKPSEERQRPSW